MWMQHRLLCTCWIASVKGMRKLSITWMAENKGKVRWSRCNLHRQKKGGREKALLGHVQIHIQPSVCEARRCVTYVGHDHGS